jgi:hypothetical protein
MKMTFNISDNHIVELNKLDNGSIEAVSMHRTSGKLWSYNFKDFTSIEEAITFYHIAF